MADHTDEEHSDKPTNTQSENPSDEIIPTIDTETIIPNQETENMEVHHHAHHDHGKKKSSAQHSTDSKVKKSLRLRGAL